MKQRPFPVIYPRSYLARAFRWEITVMAIFNRKKKKAKKKPDDFVTVGQTEAGIYLPKHHGDWAKFQFNRVVYLHGKKQVFRSFAPDHLHTLMLLLRDTAIWYLDKGRLPRWLNDELVAIAETLAAAHVAVGEARQVHFVPPSDRPSKK